MGRTVDGHKICCNCGILKELKEYYPKNTGGVRGECKNCSKTQGRERLIRNQENAKITSDVKECSKCRVVRNISEFAKGRCSDGKRADCKICNKEYRERNAKKLVEYSRSYYSQSDNKQKWLNYNKVRHAKYKSDDSDYIIAKRLRARLISAIRGISKSGSAVRDLGCTIPEFKEYISKLFIVGMSWDNWVSLWEIDHIIPLTYFDLQDREQFLQANHYTNLRPLLKRLNRSKGGRIDMDTVKIQTEIYFRAIGKTC